MRKKKEKSRNWKIAKPKDFEIGSKVGILCRKIDKVAMSGKVVKIEHKPSSGGHPVLHVEWSSGKDGRYPSNSPVIFIDSKNGKSTKYPVGQK